MKIKATQSYEKERDETITQYVERCLDGSDYDSGQLETIARTGGNNSRAISRLIEVLASKGLLTAPEITGIVGCENLQAKFLC
jgi:hypothetical protein